ncbi:hypothetical protein [Paraburkholderia sp. BCC1885]|uniref:hypothetical protein n=1 Tax=Paraburkholderia sp. BCC1885 TaxID=2562669 RepID=UPI001642DB74|nr:hypothetical protein [Paraburkholderia sp. BCC1885]
MNFGLLLSQLPHVQESRVHYDAMLSLQTREPQEPHPPHQLIAAWQRFKSLVS